MTNSSRVLSGEAAPTNHHLGKQLQLGDSFQIYGTGVEKNDIFKITPFGAAAQNVGPIAQGTYSGSELATQAQIAIQLVFGADYLVTYSDTTRKFTFSRISMATFELNWTDTTTSQNFATTVGFDNGSDDTGSAAYTSDDPVYTRDYQFAIWRFSTGNVNIKKLMISGTNLASAEQIEVFVHSSSLGELPTNWAAANWVGTPESASQSRTNDTYVWTPETPFGQYLAIWVNRSANQNQLTQDPFKIGAVGIWTDAGFDGADYGDRTIRSVFETNRVFMDEFSEAALGGNLEIGKIRGYRETTMNFGSWPEGAFYAIDKYVDKYRAGAHLFLLDPDDVDDPDKVIFGYIPPGGYGPVRGRDVNHVRDFPLTVRTLRMAPEE